MRNTKKGEGRKKKEERKMKKEKGERKTKECQGALKSSTFKRNVILSVAKNLNNRGIEILRCT